MDFTEKILGQSRQGGEVKENYIPCIIYSKEIKETILFFLDKITVTKMYHFIKKNRLLNYVFEVELEGKKYKSIIRQMQKDYVRDELLHIDFLHLHKDSKTDLKAEVIFLNKGTSSIEKGHKMTFISSPKFLPIRCVGENTISHIAVDLNDITSGTILFADQLKWPSFVTCGSKRLVLKAIAKKVVEKTEDTGKKGKKKK
jgi:large subunit ribosomal protein L25